MSHSSFCDRCHDSFDDPAYVVQVETDPPRARPVALRICPTCMQSFENWARRGERPRSGRRHRPRRTAYTDPLDRSQSWQERWLRMENVLPLIVVALLAGLGAAGMVLFSYLRRR